MPSRALHGRGMDGFSHISFEAPAITAKGLIAKLRGFLAGGVSPETPQQASDKRARERAAAGAEMIELRAAGERELPGLAAAEEKARRHLERLTPGYREAVAAYDRAQAAHGHRAHDLAYARERAERRVAVNAEPVIQECIDDLYAMLEANRRIPVEREQRPTTFDVRRNEYDQEEWSNTPAIEARRVAIFAAIQEAEALKAEPDQTGIQDSLIAMVEDLPDASVLTKVYPSGASCPAEPSTAKPRYLP